MIYCCLECVDYALEEIVNETELAPDFKRVETDNLPTATCEYCGKPAAYIVGN